MKTIDKHKQFHKEAKWALFLVFFYMVGWVLTAYLPSNTPGVLGFPLWFELSCILLPIIFVIVTAIVIKLFYKDINLEDED